MNRTRSKYLLLSLLIIVGGVVVLGWYLVSRGFSARDEPSAAEAYVARRMRRMGIPSKATAARNPVETTPEVLSEAMEHYADHCAICHGNDGKGNTLIGRGLYPKPPDMTLPQTQQVTDGELYYVIENGVRLTGMPAFGEEAGKEDSTESWVLVDFIRHLPNLSVEELETMKTMNPKSPSALEKEERIRKFLEGDDSPPADSHHEHHH
jgi:mono/diheme cytochrome c family protein